MNNLKFVLICLVVFFAGLMHAKERNIVVTAVGSGTTRNEALHDAMRKAIVKAVGAYVSTKSTLKNSDFKEEIIVNSDATVTKYQEIDAAEHHGMWIIKIRAEILPNELLKYCPVTVSNKVSSAEIGNLLNKGKTYQNVEKTMAEIFKDYYLYIYDFKKVGNIRMASDSDLSGDSVKIEVDYKASINKEYYAKFQRQLCALLDHICIKKDQWEVSTEAYYQYHYSEISDLWKSVKNGLPTGASRKDYGFIGFQHFTETTIVNTLYWVSKTTYDLMLKEVYDKQRNHGKFTCFVHSLIFQDNVPSQKYYHFIYDLRFYYIDFNTRMPEGLKFVGLFAESLNRYYLGRQSKNLRITLPKKFIRVRHHYLMPCLFCNDFIITVKTTIKRDELEKLRECCLFPIMMMSNDKPNDLLLQRASEVEAKLFH